MATTNVFFSATMQKSPASLPAQIMTEHSLDRVVYFVLRGGSDEQRSALADLLSVALLSRVPLKRAARREMWICRTLPGVPTEKHGFSHGESGSQGCPNGSVGTSPSNPCAERECNDAAHLQDYNTILHYVFGSNCRVRVRIIWRAAV